MITFAMEHALPGNLAHDLLGARATALSIAAFNRQYGLNKPLVEQYLLFVKNICMGNFGYSFSENRPVIDVLATDLPKSGVLVGAALIISIVIGTALGIVQGWRSGKLADRICGVLEFVVYASPSFAVGILLIELLAVRLHWFPAEAPQGATIGAVLLDPVGMVLPVATLSMIGISLFARYARASSMDVMQQRYIIQARMSGIGELGVLRRHVVRNAALPIITIAGITLPWMVTGGLVVEYVFNYPGMGIAYLKAAEGQDYALEIAIAFVIAVLTILGNLLADIGYALLDPRVDYSRRARKDSGR